jgi:hypothetical protein
LSYYVISYPFSFSFNLIIISTFTTHKRNKRAGKADVFKRFNSFKKKKDVDVYGGEGGLGRPRIIVLLEAILLTEQSRSSGPGQTRYQ